MNTTLGEKLKHLREQAGLSQQEVANQVGVTAEYVSMLEGGQRSPSLSLLERLASLFQREVGSLLSEEKPVFTLLLRAEGLGPEERKELGRFEQLCQNYAFVEKLADQAPPLAPTYPPPTSLQLKTYKGMEKYAERLAEAERRRLALGDEPIKDLFLLLEQQGAHPIPWPLGETSKLAGAFVYSESLGAFTLINASQRRERQNFTGAHEYCHFLKDRKEGLTLDGFEMVADPVDDGRPPQEVIANSFAANFLMPASAIRRMIQDPKHVGPEEVIYLKRYFGVSYLAMVCRLQSLGWVKWKEAEELKKIRPLEIEKRFFKTDLEDEERPLETPSRFFQLAVHVYRDDKITLGRLAELLGTSPPEIKALLADAGLLV